MGTLKDNEIKEITENMNNIKEYDSINMNNINIMINKIVYMIIDNENQKHKQRIKEMNINLFKSTINRKSNKR